MTSSTFSIVELAAELGLSRMTIYRMRAAGELPAPIPTKRRAVRWRRADIELWIQMDCPMQQEFDELKRTRFRFAKRA